MLHVSIVVEVMLECVWIKQLIVLVLINCDSNFFYKSIKNYEKDVSIII